MSQHTLDTAFVDFILMLFSHAFRFVVPLYLFTFYDSMFCLHTRQRSCYQVVLETVNKNIKERIVLQTNIKERTVLQMLLISSIQQPINVSVLFLFPEESLPWIAAPPGGHFHRLIVLTVRKFHFLSLKIIFAYIRSRWEYCRQTLPSAL